MMKKSFKKVLPIICCVVLHTGWCNGVQVKGFSPTKKVDYKMAKPAFNLEPDEFLNRLDKESTFKISIGSHDALKAYDHGRNEAAREAITKKSQKSKSHIQSIIKLGYPLFFQNKNIIAITAGNIEAKKANLIIAHDPNLKNEWAVTKVMQVNTKPGEENLWHPGGADQSGKYLAFPLENFASGEPQPRSKIIFFDISNAANPKRLKMEIDVPGRNAMAVGLTKLADGHYLLVIFRGEPEFYYSKTTNLENGFNAPVILKKPNVPIGQNASLITMEDGNLYIVTTFNTNKAAPVFKGDNMAYVLRVDFDQVAKTAKLTKVAERGFGCGGYDWKKVSSGWHCNFSAAATVTPLGNILAAYHWLIDGKYFQCKRFYK